ncbi:MAG: phosphopantetheine-binding protein [Ruminococcus flavefaciens]|nr:phosphopantetheine-binding protein [Ruminococcus flavefaciens]MCM1230974.1 phosphopantetheine-binding protein [Ruminococcus flavefaciens]
MFEQIKEIIMNYVDVEESDITENARFIEDLKFNSYDFMSFLGEVEETFEVTVEEEDVLSITTVGEAIAYIEKLQG